MAKKSISSRRRKRKQKTVCTTHVPLCGLGPVIAEKQLLAPIHQQVHIDQKTVWYRPTDKLVFALLGIVAGAESVYEINHALRPNRPLMKAFGYQKCADQSVIQQTLNAATPENVEQLEAAIDQIWADQNQMALLMARAPTETQVLVDIDLSSLPASKAAQRSKKGYAAKKKNQYGRQLARVILPQTQEIVTQSVYSGNTVSCVTFKAMIQKLEQTLELTTQADRQRFRLRLDGGFGTDENINFALWRGYPVLVKIYSGKRATKLATSVKRWVAVPSAADNTPREAGFVTIPHRYGRKTVQVAIRTPKKKGGYAYSVLVSTELAATLTETVTDYDGRSGVPESTFCQDYQGLSLRKRRAGGFEAQQMLVLLSQLAHNLCVWMKSWLSDALSESLLAGEHPPKKRTRHAVALAQKTITERGQKRFLRQVLWVSGKVVFKGKKVVRIILNPLYPLINRIKTAFEAFLKPYNIRVSLDEN